MHSTKSTPKLYKGGVRSFKTIDQHERSQERSKNQLEPNSIGEPYEKINMLASQYGISTSGNEDIVDGNGSRPFMYLTNARGSIDSNNTKQSYTHASSPNGKFRSNDKTSIYKAYRIQP